MIKEHKSTILLMIATLIWGTSFVAHRVAMEHMSPFTFNGVRFGIAGVLLLVVVLLIEMGGIRLRKEEASANNPIHALKNVFQGRTVIAGLITGSIIFAGSGLVMWGITVTGSASISSFTISTYVVLVPIAGIIIGKKTTAFAWVGVIIAVAGLYLISVPAEGFGGLNYGVIILLGAAVCWTVQILVTDRFVTSVKPLHFASVQCLIASGLSLIAAFLFEDVRISYIVAGALPILYTSLFGACIGFTLQMLGQKNVPPTRSAIVFSFETVVAAIAEAVILGDYLDGRGYFGCGLIFIGILVSQIRLKK